MTQHAGMTVHGSVALVTGGGSGIGAALVRELVLRGARVVAVSDLTAERARRTVDALTADHPEVVLEAHALDVADEVALRAHVADVEARHGRLDIVCSNAGIGTGGDIDTPTSLWQRAWDVNLMAHVWAADAALPGMLARGGGALLHTCSAAGLLTVAGDAPYAVTKHAAVALAEWLALTYGERGITVTALCPLGVETGMLAGSEAQLATRFVRGTGRVIGADVVARAGLDALEVGSTIALPHPEVARMEQARAADHGQWLARLRSVVSSLARAPSIPSSDIQPTVGTEPS
jgi:NAD(P)-dependent dehydrogenase (short-subunit alcohol dehydrogenase family)